MAKNDSHKASNVTIRREHSFFPYKGNLAVAVNESSFAKDMDYYVNSRTLKLCALFVMPVLIILDDNILWIWDSCDSHLKWRLACVELMFYEKDHLHPVPILYVH